jgi:hypothetical protein
MTRGCEPTSFRWDMDVTSDVPPGRRGADLRRASRPPTFSRVTLLAPTSADRLVDAQGRPYFLWDLDMTLVELRQRLEDEDPDVRAYFAAKVMRQAKPDDAVTLLTAARIHREWPRLQRYLGKERPFWEWLLGEWRRLGYVGG